MRREEEGREREGKGGSARGNKRGGRRRDEVTWGFFFFSFVVVGRVGWSSVVGSLVLGWRGGSANHRGSQSSMPYLHHPGAGAPGPGTRGRRNIPLLYTANATRLGGKTVISSLVRREFEVGVLRVMGEGFSGDLSGICLGPLRSGCWSAWSPPGLAPVWGLSASRVRSDRYDLR
jgi:hypothetical protein